MERCTFNRAPVLNGKMSILSSCYSWILFKLKNAVNDVNINKFDQKSLTKTRPKKTEINFQQRSIWNQTPAVILIF